MADILRMIALNPLPSETLGDFPSRRWDQLRRDVADFLKSPRAAEATRLGWTALDRRLSPPRPPTVPSRRRCGPLIGEQRRQASGRRLAQKIYHNCDAGHAVVRWQGVS